MGDEPCPQRTNTYKGSRRQLKIFCNSTVEDESTRRVLLVGEPQTVTQFVKAFFVESGSCEIEPAPVSQSDIRSPQARFEFSISTRDKLQLHTRCRHSDEAGPIRRLQAKQRVWCGFR